VWLGAGPVRRIEASIRNNFAVGAHAVQGSIAGPLCRPEPRGPATAYGWAMAADDATMLRMFDTMALVAATDDALRSAISAGSATLAYYSPRG
jgi:hypothetical protein